MRDVALGFRVHSGWTAAVAIALSGDNPVVLFRKRIQLVKRFTYEFRQPYHTAEKKPLNRAREFVARVESEAVGLATKGIAEIEKEVASRGFRLGHSALLAASARPLPALEKILASHALIRTADGELFRGAIRLACERRGLRIANPKEKGLLEECQTRLGLDSSATKRVLGGLGRTLGPPWSQDEKLSTLAAWITLVGAEQ